MSRNSNHMFTLKKKVLNTNRFFFKYYIIPVVCCQNRVFILITYLCPAFFLSFYDNKHPTVVPLAWYPIFLNIYLLCVIMSKNSNNIFILKKKVLNTNWLFLNTILFQLYVAKIEYSSLLHIFAEGKYLRVLKMIFR